MKSASRKLLLWEIGCIFWVAFAGSLLHFAFELTDYWRPIALFAAVNESAWEHTKMYFWPGLAWALAQYTYTRHLAQNYWLGKLSALVLTPLAIFTSYFSYMGLVTAIGARPSLPIMLGIMFLGIAIGQLTSWRILSAAPLGESQRKIAVGYAAILVAFGSFTYFPPRVFPFENFYCYRYTGEFGILSDYGPYRVFYRGERPGGGVNYCATPAQRATGG
ncbi:MAG: hypothetical protein FJ197_11155 [Gammaproteobacteria bacterium]|nr:hypothetical protein [Gammaproteobacteria bacterium]